MRLYIWEGSDSWEVDGAWHLWRNFLNAIHKNSTVAENIIDVIEDKMLGRPYHNCNHIKHCLEDMSDYVPDDVEKDKLALAIFFHDVIYDPKSHDNEKNSAEFMRQTCETTIKMYKDKRKNKEFYDDVEKMTLHTTHSQLLPHSLPPHYEYLLDIDLAILGKNPGEYDSYKKRC